MMWISRVLKDQVAFTENSTAEIELDESGLLSGLFVQVANKTNASLTAATKKHILEHITKVEVIGDGSKVIASMTGIEAAAFFTHAHGKMPPMHLREGLSQYTYETIPLFFGRYFKDKDYMLDLSKFNTVTLKVTNDCNSTDWTAGEFKMTVVEILAKDYRGTPKGYFKRSEQKYWTTSASATEITELPSMNLIESVLLIGDPSVTTTQGADDNSPFNYVRNVKFYTKNGDRIICDELGRHLMYTNALEHGSNFTTSGLAYMNTAQGFQTYLGYHSINMVAAGASMTIIPYPALPSDDPARVAYTKDASNNYVSWMSQGLNPYNSFMITFDEKHDTMDLLDSVAEEPVTVSVLSNTASGTVRLAISELVVQ